MNEQNVSLERSSAELDWDGIGIPTVFANALWAWVLMGLSCKPILRQVQDHAVSEDWPDACRDLLAVMLEVARRTGKLELLRRPRIRELDEALESLDGLIGDD